MERNKKPYLYRLVAFTLLYVLSWCAHAEEKRTYEQYLSDSKVVSGFFDVALDEKAGRFYLNVPKDRGQFLFQPWLARGIGSNDIGLDRGKPNGTKLVEFHRAGPKALLKQINTKYRATSGNLAEEQAVHEAFAESVLWGFTVLGESATHYLIDYTDFIVSDNYKIGELLAEQKRGEFKVEPSRSAPFFPNTRSFPQNTELEGIVTFTGKKMDEELASVTPDSQSFTVHLHHSLIALPDDGFEKRAFHPSSGFFPVSYADYSSPIESDLTQRFIRRHRLQPGGEIVYYLDPGVPEPVRSALLEGAGWWADAFAAAGFKDAFRVELLPADVDPLDVRYNVVQWVHRRTRGWSYGSSVVDPRTGEILKGKVTLGSLRIRQDVMIAQGLLSPFTQGVPEEQAALELKRAALARIRQLSAHEIGHTLGLAHNFSASAEARASVMDYPHPLLKLTNGGVDLKDAYAEGIGDWDKHAITYGYAIAESESEFLRRHVQKGRELGMTFTTDSDARPTGSSHPSSHLWDSGSDPVAELENTLAVRKFALGKMGENTIRSGTPYAELADIVVPVYYLHRYQAEAVSKLIGGANYDYSIKGEGAYSGVQPVAADTQRRALDALVKTLRPEFLETPPNLLLKMPPKAFGYSTDRENAPSLTLPWYDPVTAAEAAAESTLKLLFNPRRLARLEQHHATNGDIPGVGDLFDAVLAETVLAAPEAALSGRIQARVRLLVVEHLLEAAYGNAHASGNMALARQTLGSLKKRLGRSKNPDVQLLNQVIAEAQSSGTFNRRDTVAKIPPGSPI